MWVKEVNRRVANKLGAYVAARRNALKMTQEDMIARMGRGDRTTISKLEKGITKRPDVALLVQVAAALELDLHTLIEEAGVKDMYAAELPLSPLSPAAERVIAFTKTRLPRLGDPEGDRLIRMMEAGFAEDAPD